jgi:hypothetical protein
MQQATVLNVGTEQQVNALTTTSRTGSLQAVEDVHGAVQPGASL